MHGFSIYEVVRDKRRKRLKPYKRDSSARMVGFIFRKFRFLIFGTVDVGTLPAKNVTYFYSCTSIMTSTLHMPEAQSLAKGFTWQAEVSEHPFNRQFRAMW